MFAGRKMLRSCHVAIICDQSNSLLKMLMVDAQKLSRTLVRQIILLFFPFLRKILSKQCHK